MHAYEIIYDLSLDEKIQRIHEFVVASNFQKVTEYCSKFGQDSNIELTSIREICPVIAILKD